MLARAGPTMPAGTPDLAPPSFTETCVHSPSVCDRAAASRAAGGEAVGEQTVGEQTVEKLPGAVSIEQAANAPGGGASRADFDNAKALRLLQRINILVNGGMARDLSLLVNPADDWAPATPTRNGLVGDCKSFAAEKRRRLILAGFPAERLFYAVVFRRDIGLHALLMAHLDSGDFALDSRDPWVTPWFDTTYTYVQRQALADPMRWTNLIGGSTAAPMLFAQTRLPKGAESR